MGKEEAPAALFRVELEPGGAGGREDRDRGQLHHRGRHDAQPDRGLNADGTLDTSFNPDAGGFRPSVFSAAEQPDGQSLVTGNFATMGGMAHVGIARLLNGPAIQALTVSSEARAEWLRGGTTPETAQVTFELSNDGITWLALGAGTRIPAAGRKPA